MPEGAKIIGTACNLYNITDDKLLLILVQNFSINFVMKKKTVIFLSLKNTKENE